MPREESWASRCHGVIEIVMRQASELKWFILDASLNYYTLAACWFLQENRPASVSGKTCRIPARCELRLLVSSVHSQDTPTSCSTFHKRRANWELREWTRGLDSRRTSCCPSTDLPRELYRDRSTRERIKSAMCSMASRDSGSLLIWNTWTIPGQTSSFTWIPSERAFFATRMLSSRSISCSPT